MQPIQNATDLTAEQLRALYRYPADLDRPWVRVNFVSSIDGGVTVAGTSGGLGTPIDRRVFGLLREMADVVLVGAGTVRTENYAGTGTDVPIAVVSASGRLDPDSRLFTDTQVPPIVLAGATLSTAAILGELDRRTFRRVLCEGGPGLVGALLADDAVDELCLTTAPYLIGGTANRLAVSADSVLRRMTRETVLCADDGTILTRWVRARAG